MENAPGVVFRPLCPADYAALKLLHQRLFPLDYDDEYFSRAVHGMDGIKTWAASAPLPSLTHFAVGSADLAPQLLATPGRPAVQQASQQEQQLGQQHLQQGQHLENQQQQQREQDDRGQQGAAAPSIDSPSSPPGLLAGFITARAFPALYADPRDRQLMGLGGREADQQPLLYVLTLGVAEPFQRQGIARRLLGFVLRYAAEAACRAVYLHVASFNQAACAFYRRAGFRELAVLPDFYTIRTGRQPEGGREQYDACLFACHIQPPDPTPWSPVNLALSPLTAAIHGINDRVASCMPWGAGARKAGGSCTEPQLLEIVEDDGSDAASFGPGSGSSAAVAGSRRRVPPGRQPGLAELGLPAVLPSSQSAQAAPEWLRGLFTRK